MNWIRRLAVCGLMLSIFGCSGSDVSSIPKGAGPMATIKAAVEGLQNGDFGAMYDVMQERDQRELLSQAKEMARKASKSEDGSPLAKFKELSKLSGRALAVKSYEIPQTSDPQKMKILREECARVSVLDEKIDGNNAVVTITNFKGKKVGLEMIKQGSRWALVDNAFIWQEADDAGKRK